MKPGQLALCTTAFLLAAGCAGSLSTSEPPFPQAAAVGVARAGQPSALVSLLAAAGKEKRGEPEVAAEPVLADRPLTMQRCVEIALKNNLTLRSVALDVAKANAAVREAKSGRLPSLSLRGTYTRMDEVASFEVTGFPEMEVGELDNYAVSLSLSQPIWIGGKIGLGVQLARSGKRLAESGGYAAQQGIVFLVKKTYCDILLAGEDLKASEEAAKLAKLHVEDTARRFELGTVTRFEVTRAEVRMTGANAEVVKAGNAVKLAKTSFLDLLGLKPDTDFELADKLEYRPITLTAEEALRTALEQRPDFAAAFENVELQRLNTEMARRSYCPTLAAFGDVGWENPSQTKMGSEGWQSYWRAGVNLSWAYDHGNLAKLRQEELALKQANLGVEELHNSIRLEVTQALLSLSDAEEFLKSVEHAVTQADEGVKLAQAGYDNGVLRQLDVLDAQMGLTEARKMHARAQYAHALARLALDKAMGQP